jgi:preprotein translocase subunit YajC
MPTDQAANPMLQMVPFVFIFFIFYFLVIKPEKDKQKQKKEQLAKLARNDEVITSGGIHGVIVNIKPATVILRVDDNVKIEVDKEAVITVKNKSPREAS